MGLFKAAPGKKLHLSFYGDITDTPVTGCLPVCKAFGKEWFVKCPPQNGLADAVSHHVVPAWNIPTIKGKDVPNMTWETHTANMEFTFTPSSCKRSRTVPVDVTIYTMNLKNDLKGSIKLFRQAMPDMIKTAKEAAARESKANSLPAKWRSFMFLLS